MFENVYERERNRRVVRTERERGGGNWGQIVIRTAVRLLRDNG